MIVPLLKDDALLADIEAAPVDDGNFCLWWLGQSGFLLKWRHDYALFDPYLSDSLTRKYAGTSSEHVRMTERCLAPNRLGFAETVLCSHLHTDHCDPDTLIPLTAAVNLQGRRVKLLTPAAVVPTVKSRLGFTGIDYLGMNAGDTVVLPPFRVVAVPAIHPTLALDSEGRNSFLGFLVSFGPWVIFHSGDTLWHPGLLPPLLNARPDVVLLPINGNDPKRGVAGNLNGAEAARLAEMCGASIAIPHHFEMFGFNTASPVEFTAECDRFRQRCQVLQCGGRWSSAELKPRSLALSGDQHAV